MRAAERETVAEGVVELELHDDAVALVDKVDDFELSVVTDELPLAVILSLSTAEFVTVLLADFVAVTELVADETEDRVASLVNVDRDERVTAAVADLVAQAVDDVVAVPTTVASVVNEPDSDDITLAVLVTVPATEIVEREEDFELLDEDGVSDETGEDVAVCVDVALALGERVNFDVPVMTVDTEEEPVADAVIVLTLDVEEDGVIVLSIVLLPVVEAVGETEDEKEADNVARGDRLPEAVYDAEADIDGEVEDERDEREVPDTVAGVLIEGEGIVETVTDTDFIKESDWAVEIDGEIVV